jgi:hypothetical protein
MTLPAGQKVKHVSFSLCSAEVFTWLIHQADAKGQAVGLLHRPLWVCVTAADVAYLMGINDINAPQENLLRDRQVAFNPFLKEILAEFQLSSEYPNPPNDLSSPAHRVSVYGRHANLPSEQRLVAFSTTSIALGAALACTVLLRACRRQL